MTPELKTALLLQRCQKGFTIPGSLKRKRHPFDLHAAPTWIPRAKQRSENMDSSRCSLVGGW